MDPKQPDAADYADLKACYGFTSAFYVEAAAVKALPAAGRSSGAIEALPDHPPPTTHHPPPAGGPA